jgi:uncharacterized membrane protein
VVFVDVIVVLRLLHITGGVFWVGAVLVAVFFVEPTAKALGSNGSRFLAHLIARRRLADVMAVAAITAIGAGAVLYWLDSGGLHLAWITSPSGLAFTTGAVTAIAALAIAVFFLKPGYDRVAEIGQRAFMNRDELSDVERVEIERIEGRLERPGLLQAGLLLVTVGAMAIARYLG